MTSMHNKLVIFVKIYSSRAVFVFFQYGGQLAVPGATVVFPEELRRSVWSRFPQEGAGAYDGQYATTVSKM